jgi:dienelactone hydrolase
MSRRLHWLAAAALWSVGCVSTSWPIDPGDPVTLEPGQGLLIVHVQTDRRIESIEASDVILAEDVPEGTHVRLIGITAGSYRWDNVRLPSSNIRYRFPYDDAMRFHVEPGAINYVGMVQVKGNGSYSLMVNSIDRTAIALAELRERFPELAEKYPIVYSGPARHEFLPRYLAAAHGSERTPTAGSGPVAPISSRPDPLFRSPALLRVALNPSGTLSYSHGFDADVQILTVRNTSNGASTIVFTHSGAIDVGWVDDDTLFVQAENGDAPRRYVIDLQPLAYGVVSTQHELAARGWLIDPLPLVKNEVLWADWDGEKSSLFRVPISELIRPSGSATRFVNEPDPYFPGAFRKALQQFAVIDPKYRVAELPHLVLQWTSDRRGVPRAAIALESEDPIRIALLYREPDASGWKQLGSWSAIDPFPLPVGIAADGRNLIVLSSQGSDTAVLRTYRVAERVLGDVIYAQPGADLTGVIWDYQSSDVIAVYWEQAGIRKYHYFDAFDAAQQSWLDDLHPDEAVHLTSRTADRRLFTILVSGPRNPGQYQLLDTTTHKTEELGGVMPWVSKSRLAPVSAFDVATQDGRSIEAFLTRPQKFSGARPPLVVMPHGGPIGFQDTREFDPVVQSLAEHGYAVLQVNYRGSSGKGTGFLEAGHGAWGKGIEDDIEAALDDVESRQLVDAERVCIFGASYGGYSALISITRRPQRYRCAAAAAAPTDLLLLSSDYLYGEDRRRVFAKIVGDPDADRERLITVSPVFHAAEMDVPILLIQGDSDRVVDPEHAYRMRDMLDANGKPYEWLLLTGATHDPTPRQWQQVMGRVEQFLAKYLQMRDAGGAPRSAH